MKWEPEKEVTEVHTCSKTKISGGGREGGDDGNELQGPYCGFRSTNIGNVFLVCSIWGENIIEISILGMVAVVI